MTQLSTIPGDITPARRLHEHIELVRRMSLSRDPHEVLRAVTEKMGFVMAADARVSFNRNGLDNGAVRLTRSTQWAEDINPWTQSDRLPVFSRGLLCDLMSSTLR